MLARATLIASVLLTAFSSAFAAPIRIVDAGGAPVPTVMVSQKPLKLATVDVLDDGYPQPGKLQQPHVEVTRFTNPGGEVDMPPAAYDSQLRLRKPGFKDLTVAATALGSAPLVMERETDPAELGAQRPSNAWTSTLDFGDENLKKEFMLHCNFCHQQGAALLRRDRPAEEWKTVIKRMVRYGARLSSDGQREIPAMLEAHWKAIHNNPAQVPEGTPWAATLSGVSVRELPIGNELSQMHDLLFHTNGRVYVGDNLQDRIYEIDPASGAYKVHKLVPAPGDTLGGLLAGRLAEFPKHSTYQGIHSLAESPKDGHIFITPSYQRRLIEFDPATGAFSYHAMDTGFYPHTVRVDAQDRVWFTLALSNQIAMFDRGTRRFTYYDLPFRSTMERVTTVLMPFLFKLMSWGLPIANWVKVDHQSTGVPLPYGIDIAPDGKVWFARLHTDEIGFVDPASGAVTMVPTPFKAPRRLRADRDGNLWIAAFNESLIARYDPKQKTFTRFELPVVPLGSDTPYSLNVDRPRHQVWVNGTNSDSVYRLDIASGEWRMFPMQRRSTFTRDVEFSPDGKAYVTGAAFPSWHIEDAQPTLMEISAK